MPVCCQYIASILTVEYVGYDTCDNTTNALFFTLLPLLLLLSFSSRHCADALDTGQLAAPTSQTTDRVQQQYIRTLQQYDVYHTYDTFAYSTFFIFGAKKKNGALFQLVLGVSPRSPRAKTTPSPGHWAFSRRRRKRLGYVGAHAAHCRGTLRREQD